MTSSDYPQGWHDYVRARHKGTAGYVVAESGLCLDILARETTGPGTRVPGRGFQSIRPAELASLVLPSSWFMGVILCPGDDLRPILGWIEGLRKPDQERVVLFIHPGYDQDAGATLLREANLEHLRRTHFRGSWRDFHHAYGNHFSWQVWNDKE